MVEYMLISILSQGGRFHEKQKRTKNYCPRCGGALSSADAGHGFFRAAFSVTLPGGMQNETILGNHKEKRLFRANVKQPAFYCFFYCL